MMTTSPGRSSGTSLGNTGFEQVSTDWPVEHHRGDHAGHAQASDQGGRLAMAMGEAQAQPLASPAPTMSAGLVSSSPPFVDKDKALRSEIKLAVEPALPVAQDVGPVLLDCVPDLFLRVFPCRAKKRCTVPIPTGAPRSISRAWTSTRVMSPRSTTNPLMKSPCASTPPEWRSPPRSLATAWPC